MLERGRRHVRRVPGQFFFDCNEVFADGHVAKVSCGLCGVLVRRAYCLDRIPALNVSAGDVAQFTDPVVCMFR